MSKGDLLTLLKNDEKKSVTVLEMISMIRQAASGMAYLGKPTYLQIFLKLKRGQKNSSSRFGLKYYLKSVISHYF
jgi:hypothetical protein